MADVVDTANDQTEVLERMRINEVRQRVNKQEVEATGACLNCFAKVAEPRRWCDAICRDEWQERKQ